MTNNLISSSHFYFLRFIALIVIAILVMLPHHLINAQPLQSPSQQGKMLTPENLEKNSYQLWLACFQAWKQGKKPDVPNLGIVDSVDPKEAQRAHAVWEQAKFRAYLAVEGKGMYQTWLNFWQAKEKGQQTAAPILKYPDVFDADQANRIQTLWEQAYTKAHLAVFEKGAYQTWLDYYQALLQGGQPPLPELTIPAGIKPQEVKQAQEVWQQSQVRAQRKAQQSAQAQARQTKQPSIQADNIEALSDGKITTSLPDVVIDDATRQQAARSIIPLQDVTIPNNSNPQPVSGINRPKGIAGVFAYAANSTQPGQLQSNSPEAIAANNNNRIIAELNADTVKAKTSVNTETAKKLIEKLDSRNDQTNINPAVSGGPQLVRRYTYGLQGPISMSQLINGQWVTSFFIYDGEGNIRMLTDENGTVTDTYDYDAWGNVINRTGNTPNTRLYRAEEWDPDLSMYYLRNRYYQSATGRFWTQDSYEGFKQRPQSLHKYTYANNNPVNMHDPSGRFAITNALTFNGILKGIAIFNAFTQPILQALGADPFPLIRGGDLTNTQNAMIIARAVPIPNFAGQTGLCDTALAAYEVPSLRATISRLEINRNVFDGRNSTYVDFKQRTFPYKRLFQNVPSISAETVLNVPGRGPVVFLAQPFFDFMTDERRAVTLLHESAHAFGALPYSPFLDPNFPGGSKAISIRIKNDCFPRVYFPGDE